MATKYQPPPTYALPIVKDEKTGESTFSPIWLKWFVDLASVLGAAGAGGGPSGGAIQHNSLGGLQGGSAPSEFYHLTAAEHSAIGAGDGSSLVLAQRTYAQPSPQLMQDQGILMNQIFGA